MATIIHSKKACSVSPLKMSQPIGGALAFMGINRSMPVLHGSQGCTAFGLVLFVRHFREMIPLQTTAMNEVTTIMGGLENIEQAIVNIYKRAHPALIGICSTGLTETKGDDVESYLKIVRQRHPEVEDCPLVYVSTPDFVGAFQDGWGKAVSKMIEVLVEESSETVKGQINILAGSHLSAADIEEIKEMVEDFGLRAIILPDISGSLDGHVPEDFTPTTIGGTPLEKLKEMGKSEVTIAIGEQMRAAAMALEIKTGVPFYIFERLTGLASVDLFIERLSIIAQKPVPNKYRRQRSQLVDAMLDCQFYFGGLTIALGAEPDLLWAIGNFLVEMGAKITVAITTTESVLLPNMPCETVTIGDLEDLETMAKDADLMLTHSHGRGASRRLGIPLYRIGLPMFDRVGAAHRLSVGYRGSRNILFEITNLLIEQEEKKEEEKERTHFYTSLSG
ncbi:nitrogenase molybdenum-cofactor biosynthesis protein NifN [Methylacidiphilum kamchatkense Kam1]|uniref:Nitrogenase iron-molybdenum cofactor biosynthesis protein NifN n=1 Tax=Methylacidiphilum kamchatkense Kam1 TaxID=1202785 RepID=A0A0C1RVB0_9BACT|nr:nitrogenase iron-molybdenum cofactor biosynthesis protein NifN [Methylacidiphilum kamchatkense]KIE58886.1 nitrogenase molybdenum-cofactor biosynthesis protein NifN [Methylacidiphilum kamchatkense Kam1]QDQ41686.1 nitrogenase molybdenum-iron protein NifN [Methylacidiphilum kamchatkense Kam1]